MKCRAENGILLAGYHDDVIKDICFDHVTLNLQRPLGQEVEYDLRPDDHNGKIQRPLKAINDLSRSQYSIKDCDFD